MVTTRSQTLSNGTPLQITVSVSWYGQNRLYFAGLLTIIDSISKFNRRFLAWNVIVHHDDSVPPEWLEVCRHKEHVKLVDESRRNLTAHYRMYWRFLTMPHCACCMILDIDEDTIALLHAIETFWLPEIRRSVARGESRIYTHTPNWMMNNTPVVLPGNFMIATHPANVSALLDVERLIHKFIRIPYTYDGALDRKHETGEFRGSSYGTDEMFLNTYLLPKLTIPIWSANFLDHVVNGSKLKWTPYSRDIVQVPACHLPSSGHCKAEW